MTLSGYLGEMTRLFAATEAGASLDDGAARAVGMIRAARDGNRAVIVIGNGGSAAIASHMQNDLCKAVGVRSLVFTEPPLLTALSNDESYESAYESLLRLWAAPGDLLVAISSSGKSPNILRAARAAREAGCGVITLSGFGADNPLRTLGDVNFYVPSPSYGHVEAVHGTITQYLTDALKRG